MSHIGTLGEGPLHAALKAWVTEPGDRVEVPVDGFVVDVVRGDALIEVQTGGFSPLGPKLDALLDSHPTTIVTPLAYRTRITKLGDGGEIVDERWSPRREGRMDAFGRLVSFPTLVAHPNLTVLAVGIVQREVRRHHEGKAWRRRGWVVEERHLTEVVETTTIASVDDAASLLPPELSEPFTTADLARAAAISRRLSQQVAYCLREMSAIREVGRSGNAREYVRS
jgi:hypothetical protein